MPRSRRELGEEAKEAEGGGLLINELKIPNAGTEDRNTERRGDSAG